MNTETFDPAKPILEEAFTDNGEHSHWRLIDPVTGVNLWSQDPTEDAAIGYPIASVREECEKNEASRTHAQLRKIVAGQKEEIERLKAELKEKEVARFDYAARRAEKRKQNKSLLETFSDEYVSVSADELKLRDHIKKLESELERKDEALREAKEEIQWMLNLLNPTK
jgi:exonuclease VII large subunit